ncbi:ANTAR domain-containing protein [Streptomyces sp. NPDC050658]|uniref:ANTAR domain-containing protein n=1 Tax=unclassified Streptomyces TaxID=2593676 RepID=UPI00342C9FBC
MLGIAVRPTDDRTVVAVTGEAGIVTEHELEDGLRTALDSSVHGIDLDLDGVDFFDCSGLNALLRVRRYALESGKSVTVQRANAAVRRLLSATGRLYLLSVPAEAHETGPSGPPDDAEQDLRTEICQLRRAMETRPVIDLARGVLMASYSLDAQDAWNVLVSLSQNTNTKLHLVAEELVSAVKGDSFPEPLKQQMAATLAGLQTAGVPSPARPDGEG